MSWLLSLFGRIRPVKPSQSSSGEGFDVLTICDKEKEEPLSTGVKSGDKAMHILVDRFVSNDDATLSKVYVDGKHQCDGLEDEYRRNKVSGKTRIPAGTYKVGVRTVGGFHNRYSQMFPSFHKGMLHVLDVPNFKYILHHIGNWHTNTDGCLLVGSGDEKAMAVWLSKNAYRRYYKKVIGAALAGNLTVEYRDSDGKGA